MVTIKDVAKRADVSVATVSRVIRGIGYISEDAKRKVMEASEELGYVANASAQKLKNKNLETVGFIISDINNPYYFGIAASLQKFLAKKGVELVLAFSSENPVDEDRSFRYLISSNVSAILFTPTNKENRGVINIAIQNGIKVVQVFRKIYDNLDTIINDDENGCYEAGRYLIGCGYKRILLLDVDYPYISYEQVVPSREKGLLRLNGEKGVEIAVEHLNLLGGNAEQIQKSIEAFNPDAVISATSNFGVEVLQYLKENNRNVRLVTFDDDKWFELCDVSAIRQNDENLADNVFEMIKPKEAVTRTVVLKQTLVCRDLNGKIK